MIPRPALSSGSISQKLSHMRDPLKALKDTTLKDGQSVKDLVTLLSATVHSPLSLKVTVHTSEAGFIPSRTFCSHS